MELLKFGFDYVGYGGDLEVSVDHTLCLEKLHNINTHVCCNNTSLLFPPKFV